jgi:serine/threonine protein kinase
VKSIRYHQDFCVKILPRIDAHSFSEQTFRAEFGSLMRLSHPGIVRLYMVWSTELSNFPILEYISHGSMSTLIEQQHHLDDDSIHVFGSQLLSSLVYCHSKSFCHGYIQPAKILIDDRGRERLADFGLSGTIAELAIDLQHIRGSVAYLPPERLIGIGRDPQASDVWAHGVTFFEMATGCLPWTLTSIESALEQIKNGAVVYPETKSLEFREVLEKMFIVNESERATMAEVLDMPFFHQTQGLPSFGGSKLYRSPARINVSLKPLSPPKSSIVSKVAESWKSRCNIQNIEGWSQSHSHLTFAETEGVDCANADAESADEYPQSKSGKRSKKSNRTLAGERDGFNWQMHRGL